MRVTSVTNAKGSALTWARQFAFHFSQLPVHPQWFSFLAKRRATKVVTQDLRGVVLDIGCGRGELKHKCRTVKQYIGVDYPPTGKEMYHAKPSVFADASRLPFASAIADCVVLLDVVEHLREPDAAFAEAARVLRSGGRLFVHIPYLYPLHDVPHDYVRFTEFGLVDRLRKAGFTIDRLEPNGTPTETAVLLANIALARVIWLVAKRFPPAILLALAVLPLFLIFNLGGWCVGRLSRDLHFMPLTYFIVARRDAVALGP